MILSEGRQPIPNSKHRQQSSLGEWRPGMYRIETFSRYVGVSFYRYAAKNSHRNAPHKPQDLSRVDALTRSIGQDTTIRTVHNRP